MSNPNSNDRSADTDQAPSAAGTIAVVLANDFEDSEFTEPRDALLDAGYTVEVIGSETGTVTGKNGTEVTIDRTGSDVDADDYAGLLIPGGFSPDHLRTDQQIVALVTELVNRPVPTGAICHAPSLLIEAGVVDGRKMTGYQSIRTDLVNAGADVSDSEVVVDENLISSRHPGDIPAFNDALLSALRSNVSMTRGLGADPENTEPNATT